jgi:general secretion pathway protein B
MSYILEALKKAQAERQLGNAPDIHAPAPGHLPAAARAPNRKPLLIGLGVGLALAGLAAGLVLRSKTPQGEPAVLAQAATPAAPLVVPPAAPALPAADAVAAPPARDTVPTEPPPAAPQPAAPKPAARAVPTPPAPRPAAVRDAVPEPVYLPAPAPAPAAPARAPDPAPEENLRTLQQLPEAIQREVPRVAVGGYIYSPNPADRLLLIDKTLRREGEEVAPGLVLERLMPKYAVMNYRGTRYRVGY